MINETVIVTYLNNKDDLVFYVGSDVYIMYREVTLAVFKKFKLFKNNQLILEVKTNGLNVNKNKITCIAKDIDDLNELEFVSSSTYYYKNRKLYCKFWILNKLRFILYIDNLAVGKAYYTQPWFGQETRYDIELFIPDEFLLPFLIMSSQVIPLLA